MIGMMVASGNLQSLSATLSAEQADLSFRIEECGLGFVRGDMNFSQAQACLGGTLHPVALGQSAAGELNAENTSVAYLIQIDEPLLIAVELSHVEVAFPARVTITDETGSQVASGDELRQIGDTSYIVIQGIELPAGRYIVSMTQDGTRETTFRLKVREFEPGEAADDKASLQSDTGTELADTSRAAVGLDVGNRAPDFTITTITGEAVTLSELRGQMVLLNFWGTWCGPCRREMPEFQVIYTTHEDEEFTILALAVRGDTEANVIQFREEFGLTFILAVDESNRINDIYSIVSQPSTLILDEEGTIIYRSFGITPATQIEGVIQEVLGS
jgi:peroxiredoxin